MTRIVRRFVSLTFTCVLPVAVLLSLCVTGHFARAGTAEDLAQPYWGDHPDNVPPEGFIALFNGTDLTNWKGLVSPAGGPPVRAKMSPEKLAEEQAKADQQMRDHWKVVDGILTYDGLGQSLCSAKDYDDIELWVDWKITPRVTAAFISAAARRCKSGSNDKPAHGIGSGGLYNNQKKENPHDPLVLADNPIGQWNRYFIRMVGDKVTVYLNKKLVTDNVVLENYWERSKPIYAKGQIELQHHHSPLFYKNIFLRELPK